MLLNLPSAAAVSLPEMARWEVPSTEGMFEAATGSELWTTSATYASSRPYKRGQVINGLTGA
jgi:hypothetical protein